MTYQCRPCMYTTNRKSNWVKHITTAKHLKIVGQNHDVSNKNEKSTLFSCEYCGKKYRYASGLSRHRINCNDEACETSELFENPKNLLRDQQKQISKSIPLFTSCSLH